MIEYAQEPIIEDQESTSSPSNQGLNLRPYLRTLKRKAWLVASVTSIVGISAFIWSSFDPDNYIGNFYLLVEPITSAAKLTDPTTLTRTGGVPKDDLFALDYPTNLAFLRSPGMTYRIAKDVHDKKSERAIPAIWKDLRDNLKIERLGTTQSTATKIFEVSYQGQDAQEVQAILETAAQTYLKYSAEDRETSLKAGVSFIDKQLPELIQRLNKLQSEQQKMRQEYDLLDPVSKGQSILEQIKEIDVQAVTLETELRSLKLLHTNLAQQLKLTPQEGLVASSLSQDQDRTALLDDLRKIETQIATESARFTSQSPVIQTLEEQKANLTKLLDRRTEKLLSQSSTSSTRTVSSLDGQNPLRLKLIERYVDADNQIQIIEARRQFLAATKVNLEKQARNYPEMIRNYQDIDRKILLTTQLLDRLQTQRETLRVEAAQELPWQLISKPQIPLDKDGKPISYPPERKKKVLAGVGAGLLASSLLAILLEKRRNKFYSSEDVQDFLTVPLIGDIPWDRTLVSETVTPLSKTLNSIQPTVEDGQRESQTFSTLAEALSPEEQTTTLLNAAQQPSHTALTDNSGNGRIQANVSQNTENLQHLEMSGIWESERSYSLLSVFDAAYSQLCLLHNPHTLRSLVVSSVEPDDGQSTVAIYLANAAAATGSRVLLVDANWHNPQLHDCFNLPNYRGLYQLMTSSVNSSEVIQSVPQSSNLFLLTSGLSEAEPRKRLWSHTMKELMAKLEQEYDLVIYDVPHFFDSADINLMTIQTDGLLLVVSVFKTSQGLVKKAIDEIKRLKIPFLGVVTNHTKEQSVATWF